MKPYVVEPAVADAPLQVSLMMVRFGPLVVRRRFQGHLLTCRKSRSSDHSGCDAGPRPNAWTILEAGAMTRA
jgi:hypothetical protein